MRKYGTNCYCFHYICSQIIVEVPGWWYAMVFFLSLGVGIGCSYAGPNGTVLLPAWSIIVFTSKQLDL